MGAVGAGALLLSAWLGTLFQRRHCRIKDWRYSLAAMDQSTCLLGSLWVVTSPATTLVCLAQPAATSTNMPPLLAKRAMQGPTIQGASQRLHAISVMLGATADLGRQTAHCVMLDILTPRREAIPHPPAFLVMQDLYALKKGFLDNCNAPQAVTVLLPCKCFFVQPAPSLRNQVFSRQTR